MAPSLRARLWAVCLFVSLALASIAAEGVGSSPNVTAALSRAVDIESMSLDELVMHLEVRRSISDVEKQEECAFLSVLFRVASASPVLDLFAVSPWLGPPSSPPRTKRS